MQDDYHTAFLEGNELIEKAIEDYDANATQENLLAILSVIRQRMIVDGQFILPVIVDEADESRFAFRTLRTKDGKNWNAVFTTAGEFERGEPSQVLPMFIDKALKICLESEADGFVLNPWGKYFILPKELIQIICRNDDDVEYQIPEDTITPELLEDGAFLKRATQICSRNRTQRNFMKLAMILRDSYIWIPCNAVMSDADYKVFEKAVNEAKDGDGFDTLVGQTFTTQDKLRLIPDILQNEDKFFFPVFTSVEEMGEYGEHFSKVEKHFLESIHLARNNEKDITGIVINAFSDPFVIPVELFDLIENLESNFKGDSGNE